MPSTHVRGQANLHDSVKSNSNNSNKRKKVDIYNQCSKHNFNMQPDEEVNNNHHAELLSQKQVSAAEVKEEEAAAVLHCMHLVQHADHEHASVQIDHHNGLYAAADHQARVVADRGMLQPAAAYGVRANSGSSDASAAFFSGDSDLTAEPIMGRSCATDDNEADGAKSSNSGSSSTPLFKHKHSLAACTDHTHQAPQAKPVINVTTHKEKMCNANEEVGYVTSAHEMGTTIASNIAPSTSTTASGRRCTKILPDSQLMSSPNVVRMRVHEQQISSCCKQHHTSPPEYADSGGNSESCWLELRLGFSDESRQEMQAAQNLYDDSCGERQRKWRESVDIDMTEEEPLTLQLLPENNPNATETCSRAATKPLMPVQGPPLAVSGLYPSSNPPIYHPTFLHNGAQFDTIPNRVTSGASPCGTPFLINQTRDLAAPSQYGNQVLYLNQSSNQSFRSHASLSGSFDARLIAPYEDHMQLECNDRHKRWASSEARDMNIVGGPPSTMNIATAHPPEVYRPTASLGWPPGTALASGVEGRPWSASSIYNIPQAQAPNSMSWQGLLRSMASDPFLHAHTLQDVPMHSFDNAANILHTGLGMRRRHIFPPACARPPSSHANASPPAIVAPQRLRLASSRRSTDLWFSLQEADHSLNEKLPTQSEQQLSDHHQPTQKLYLRIRDGKMQISVVKNYLIKKLGSAGAHLYDAADEVEITCRGQILSPMLTMQHVRDTIWLSKDIDLNSIGFRYTTTHINNSQNRVMALCYQRHRMTVQQTVTLNLLKI